MIDGRGAASACDLGHARAVADGGEVDSRGTPDPAQASFPRGAWRSWLALALAPLPSLALFPMAVGGRALLTGIGARAGAERFAARVQRTWARWTLHAFGVRVSETGPDGPPALVVSNHHSWLDILVLASRLDCRFVAKAEIASWPLFGLLARSVGTVFIDRSSRRDALAVGNRIEELLGCGVSVVLFAEGRVTDGRDVARFHSALFEPAVRAGIQCRPVALQYRTPRSPYDARHSVGWWGDVGLVWHAWRLPRFGPVEAGCAWASSAIVDGDRKRLAERARAAVREAYRAPAPGPLPPGDPRPPLDDLGRSGESLLRIS